MSNTCTLLRLTVVVMMILVTSIKRHLDGVTKLSGHCQYNNLLQSLHIVTGDVADGTSTRSDQPHARDASVPGAHTPGIISAQTISQAIRVQGSWIVPVGERSWRCCKQRLREGRQLMNYMTSRVWEGGIEHVYSDVGCNNATRCREVGEPVEWVTAL